MTIWEQTAPERRAYALGDTPEELLVGAEHVRLLIHLRGTFGEGDLVEVVTADGINLSIIADPGEVDLTGGFEVVTPPGDETWDVVLRGAGGQAELLGQVTRDQWSPTGNVLIEVVDDAVSVPILHPEALFGTKNGGTDDAPGSRYRSCARRA